MQNFDIAAFAPINTVDEAAESRTAAQAPDPATSPDFASQSLGGIFDTAFDLYKQHFATLALIVACVYIPTQVALHAAGNLWLRPLLPQFNSTQPDFLVFIKTFSLAFLIGVPQSGVPGYISLLTSFLSSGPLSFAVGNLLLRRSVDVPTAYRRALPMFGRLFCIWTLFFLLFFVIFWVVFTAFFFLLVLVAAALSGLGSGADSQIGVVFVIVMLIVPYFVSVLAGTMLFGFTPPLIALENQTIIGAISRNIRITSGKQFRRVALAFVMLPVVTFGLQIITLISAQSFVEALKWPSWAGFVLNTGLSSLIGFFFQPYWMVFVTALYFDCRIRKEGLDVRFLADNLPAAAPPASVNSSAAPNGMGGDGNSPDARLYNPRDGQEADKRHAY